MLFMVANLGILINLNWQIEEQGDISIGKIDLRNKDYH